MKQIKVVCKCNEKCIGCDKVDNLENCDGTMCHDCWLKETADEE